MIVVFEQHGKHTMLQKNKEQVVIFLLFVSDDNYAVL